MSARREGGRRRCRLGAGAPEEWFGVAVGTGGANGIGANGADSGSEADKNGTAALDPPNGRT